MLALAGLVAGCSGGGGPGRDEPPSRPQAAAPAPTTRPAPVPPLDAPEACAFGAPPQPGLMAECDRRKLDRITREALRDGERLRQAERARGLRPSGGRSWSPSSPRPIQPYPAWPGDPNDRDHDGRSCESGCIN